MHDVARGRIDEAADLLDTGRREPALSAATLDCKAIRCFLVRTAKLVGALVAIDP